MKKTIGLYGAGAIATFALQWRYWGFPLQVPKVDDRLTEFTSVRSVSKVISRYRTGKIASLENDNAPSSKDEPNFKELIANTRKYWTDAHQYPLLRFIQVLPDEKLPTIFLPAPSDLLVRLDPYLLPQGFLTQSTYRFEDGSRGPFGYVVIAEHPHLKDVVFVSLRGSMVSDDHYPYEEILFSYEPSGALKELSRTRFYFDVAGLEVLDVFAALMAYTALFGIALLAKGIIARR